MDIEDDEVNEVNEVKINCRNLSKIEINGKIRDKVRNLTKVKLLISNYNHDDLKSIILPNSLLEFDCYDNRITSFAGLILPPSLIIFSCYNNQITSFKSEGNDLKLPDSLREFVCSQNQISSFEGLQLSFSLTKFVCSQNRISSFAKLILPPSIIIFNCLKNDITIIENFEFPSKLERLIMDDEIVFINHYSTLCLEKG
jgi:hypothetical protein